MTEKSYFFEEEEDFPVGDSAEPYSHTLYQLFISLLLSVDRTKQGPVYSVFNAFDAGDFTDNCLNPGASAWPNAVIGKGIGICDGAFYANTSDVSFDCTVAGYYRVVLRTSRSGGTNQTTRLAILYDAGAYQGLTQDANTWEIPIARFKSDGAATFDQQLDDREFVNNNIFMRARRGGDDYDWHVVGESDYPVASTMIEVGATEAPASLQLHVEFRKGFIRPPFVFVTPFNYSAGSPSHGEIVYIRDITDKGFDVCVEDVTNIEGYNWIAIGPLYDEKI